MQISCLSYNKRYHFDCNKFRHANTLYSGWIYIITLSNSIMFLLSGAGNGTYLIDDRALRVWNVSNGTELACLNKYREYHGYGIKAFCWSHDDCHFGSGGYISS